MTLRVKTMLTLVVTVVVALGGSRLFFLHHFENAFRKSFFQTVDSMAQVTADSIHDYLRNQRALVKYTGRTVGPFYTPKDVGQGTGDDLYCSAALKGGR